jgi:Ca2+-binding RTX toxin-like protein
MPFVLGVIITTLLLSPVWLTPTATIPAALAQTAITCDGKAATIIGTPESDNIVGTPNRDVIVTLGGDDTVRALGGNDTVCGGTGNEFLDGDHDTDSGDGGPNFYNCINLETVLNCENSTPPEN